MTGASPAMPRSGQPFGGDASEVAPSPDSAPAVWSPWLLGLLTQQLELYTELERLSRGQSELVASGRTDELISLLGRRQAILDRVTELSARAAPLRERWTELADRVREPERSRLRDVIASIDLIVSEISRRDDADRQAMERERTAIADELASVSHSRGAVAAYTSGAAASAYGRAATPGPRFQDRKG